MASLTREKQANTAVGVLILLVFGIILYFYGFHHVFHPLYGATAFAWLAQGWNSTNELNHGPIVPFIILFLLWRERKVFVPSPARPSWLGLAFVALGIFFYWASVRTVQQRIMVGSFPILMLGCVYFVWGWPAAKSVLFPLSLLYFIIPIPGLLQATNGLQLIATKGAYHLTQLVGVDVIVSGNNLISADGSWGKFQVAEGCSGIRSLMAMGLVAAIYAHVTERVLWKQMLIFFLALPLAVVANLLRVTSIILIADFVNPAIAANLYHDWSAFLFFPFALLGLVVVGQLLNFSNHFRHQVTVVGPKNSCDATPGS